MNDAFIGDTTPALLRQLADQLERECAPDFMLAVINGDTFSTAHIANSDVFGLIGAIEYRKALIISEVD